MAGRAWQHSTVMSRHTQGKKQTLLITFHTDNLTVHFGARECGILADIHNYVCKLLSEKIRLVPIVATL